MARQVWHGDRMAAGGREESGRDMSRSQCVLQEIRDQLQIMSRQVRRFAVVAGTVPRAAIPPDPGYGSARFPDVVRITVAADSPSRLAREMQLLMEECRRDNAPF